MADDWYRAHLACPDCRRPLSGESCACGFVVRDRDLRPQNPPARALEFTLGFAPDLDACRIERPRVTYSGPRALRDSSELFSAIEPQLRRGATLLDLGCGPRDQAAPAAHYGLQYVGADVASLDADLRIDAHAIPFRDATFDVVFSYAVLEHLANPFLAVHEIARVLKPGGVFVGTVSQGEPFHDSYFHHTAFGLLSVLAANGLHADQLWPSYDTLHALATMGRYPRVLRLLIELVHRAGRALPMLAPRKFFRWTPRERAVDELHRAASICFTARRTAD
ncbi:MAG TPA: class I SAM-dependent methyltransferase [Thermoanaerobaculia bacterium]|nr:class I SAM-dependent methyltransferase [Thermoanaerobaculia bacterium]